MNFESTLLYKLLKFPGDHWNNSCGYVFAMKLPEIFLATVADRGR